MRIAIFTDLYLEVAGGICTSIAAQKEALKAAGHEVKIFCPGRKTDDPDVILVPTSWLNIEGAPMGKRPGRILKFLDEEFPDFGSQFDIIHVHYEAEVSIAAVIAARKYNLPLVQTMHGREDIAVAMNFPKGLRNLSGLILCGLHKKYLGEYAGEPVKVPRDKYLATTYARRKMWELMVREANTADVTLTPAAHFRDKLRHYGAREDIEILQNGVLDKIALGQDWPVRKFDESYVKDGEKLRMVWTTRVSHEKRIIPFLEALTLVHAKTDGFFLTVIGDGNDMRKAREFVQKHGLSDSVSFLGQISHEDVLDQLRNQHISVTNSYGFDVQPLTLLEAVALGVPVLICDPDMEGLLPSGVGVRAKNETPEAMAETILDLIDHPKQIEKMSRRAFDVREEVLQSTQIKRLIKTYEKLIKDR